jgi:ABC-type antimicrobial peptide transport system permease subunit
MGAIAFLILITACINFINLSTARSFDRAREVGIKKTGGASRKQLIVQFMSETFVMTLISLLVALVMVEIALPLLNRAFESNVSMNLMDLKFLLALAGILVITGILSGTYPAFLLSSFNPVKALQNKKSGRSGKRIRKVLVVLQFTISIFTILATVMMVSQLRYMQHADLGFNKDHVLIIPARGHSPEKYEVIKNDLLNCPDITQVTMASEVPDNVNAGEIEWGSTPEMVEENQNISWNIRVGYDFDKTFDLSMEEGRFFDRDHATDSMAGVIINREIANILDYKDPVGKPFYIYDDAYTIIGVIQEFNFFPLDLAGKALFMTFSEDQPLIFLRYHPGAEKEAIQYAQNVFREQNPNYPYEYFFYDDYDRIINNIGETSSTLLLYFSLFGLFISTMGLLGLAIFSAEVRTKEFGIRKAFGATVKNIVIAQSREFALLIFLAHLIAIPLAYLVVNKALDLFTYKINLSIWYFVFTMTGVYLISFLTTGWQAFSAARKNPADALRYE